MNRFFVMALCPFCHHWFHNQHAPWKISTVLLQRYTVKVCVRRLSKWLFPPNISPRNQSCYIFFFFKSWKEITFTITCTPCRGLRLSFPMVGGAAAVKTWTSTLAASVHPQLKHILPQLNRLTFTQSRTGIRRYEYSSRTSFIILHLWLHLSAHAYICV